MKLSVVTATWTSSAWPPTSLGSSWITGDLWVRLHAKQGLEYLAMSPWSWRWATAAHTHKSERNIILLRSGEGIASVVLYPFEIPAYYFNWVFQGKLYDSMLNSKQVSGWKWFRWVKSEPVIANAFVLVCFTRRFKCVLWWYCLFQDVKEKRWGREIVTRWRILVSKEISLTWDKKARERGWRENK